MYKKAINKWGYGSQINMVIEELSELIVVIQQDKRGRTTPKEMASEIVDAKIMLEQLIIMFDNEELIDEIKKEKLERLEKRLEREELING